MYAAILLVLIGVGQVRVEPERWAWYGKEVVVAETIWTNALADGDFNAAGNWTGGVPSNANTPAILNGTSQTPPTVNLDRSAGTAFEFVVAPEFGSANIGASGSPLILVSNAGDKSATLRHSGTTYLTLDGAFGSNVIVDDGTVVLNTTNGANVTTLMLRGKADVTVASTCDMGGACFVVGNQCRLDIAEQSAAESPPYQFILAGGVVVNRRTYAETANYVVVVAGEFTQTGVLSSLTDVLCMGGVFKYEPVNDPTGDAIDIYAPTGIFDSRGYGGSLAAGQVISGGGGGLVLGSIATGGVTLSDYNLDDPYPGS
jgi:hypothetical protein